MAIIARLAGSREGFAGGLAWYLLQGRKMRFTEVLL